MKFVHMDWMILIYHPMGIQTEQFQGTPEECAHQVIKRAIETERTVTAHSPNTETVYDSRVLDW